MGLKIKFKPEFPLNMLKNILWNFKEFFCCLSMISLGMFFFACQPQPEIDEAILLKEVGTAKFEISDQYKVIELDNYSGIVNEIKGITDQKQYYFYNTNNHSIYLYDLETVPQQPKSIIKVPFDESINFKVISDLVYHNADSIFIWDEFSAFGNRSELFLINSKAEVVDVFNVLDGESGEPGKARNYNTNQGRSMIYHDGKIILLSSIEKQTKKENWKPLIVFDIRSRLTSFHGTYPAYFNEVKFGQNKWKSNYCIIPELNQVVVSFPFEKNIFIFDLDDYSWNELEFNSDLVSVPKPFDEGKDGTDIYYAATNSWYFGLEYDRANGLIWRTAQIGKQFGMNDTPPFGGYTYHYLTINNDRNYFHSFLIDPVSYNYWILSGLHWLETQFFHPTSGPHRRVDKHKQIGLNPEDNIIFSPLTLELQSR